MKNVPQFIYLNVGDDPEETFDDFKEACRQLQDDLTWCEDPIDCHTIKYRLYEPSKWYDSLHLMPNDDQMEGEVQQHLSKIGDRDKPVKSRKLRAAARSHFEEGFKAAIKLISHDHQLNLPI